MNKFTLDHVTKETEIAKQYAGRYFNRVTDETVIKNLTYTLTILNQIQSLFPDNDVVVYDAYNSDEIWNDSNAYDEKKEKSYYRNGTIINIAVKYIGKDDVYDAIKKSTIPFTRLIKESSTTSIICIEGDERRECGHIDFVFVFVKDE